MSKICPNCLEVFDDSHGFCSNCGSRLVDNVDVNPALNLGDANAISGGIHVNQSKNITSHDTHYHTTTVERSKSESELRLDATNQLRAKAEEIMAERGRIDSVAMGKLRPLATQLGIDDETFKSIIKDVRSNRNGSSNGLSAANARYLQQAQQAVQTNDMDGLSNLTPRLEAMAAISQDDNVQYLYYLTLSLLYPIKSMEVYERQTDENYWRSFWAIISYIRTGKHAEAAKVLALFDPLRYEKSEEDQNLLEAYFNIMKEDKDGAQEFLDEILGEPTEQVKPLLRAVESKLYEEEPDSLEVRFYMERVMSKSDVVVKSQKKVDASTSAEIQTKETPKQEVKLAPKTAEEVKPVAHEKKNNKEAEELYTKACSAAGPKRVMMLQKAAEAGSLEAMYDLSDCYYDGEGVDKNMPLAIKWMTKAADGGYVKAQAALGAAYCMGGDGLDQSYTLSEKYLLMAANKDNVDAQAFLSTLYIAIEDYEKAMVWARKATQMEHPQACLMLGRIYDEGLGVDVNHTEGLKWFEKAADKGDADAQNIVGNIYLNADYVENNPQKAFKNFQKAAAQGHLDGMANLAYCYQEGIGTDMNIIFAEEWLRKAADGGLQDAIDLLNENPLYNKELQIEKESLTREEANALYDAIVKEASRDKLLELQKAAESGNMWGMNCLGLCYENGHGVEQDYAEAVKWYRKAAEAGNAIAMSNLGICYDNGNGVDQDFAEAVKWYRKAAEAGNAIAMYNLGICYYNGDGVEQDYAEAVKWYRKAAEAGDADAMTRLGICYEGGDGVEQDYAEAVKWYRKAAEAGDAIAMGFLGLCYENGKGVNKNQIEAVKWYRKGAESGDIDSMQYLAVCYDNGNGVVQDYAEALKWFQKAAEGGNMNAMNFIGTYYHNGKGVIQDYVEAAKWYEKGIELGDSWAMSNMGILYQFGLGVKKDETKAYEYYEMSAKLGNETAKQNLETLKNTVNKKRKVKKPNSQKELKELEKVDKKGKEIVDTVVFNSIRFDTDGRKTIFCDVDLSFDKVAFSDGENVWLAVFNGSKRLCSEWINPLKGKIKLHEQFDYSLLNLSSGYSTRSIKIEIKKGKKLLVSYKYSLKLYYKYHLFGKNVLEIQK